MGLFPYKRNCGKSCRRSRFWSTVRTELGPLSDLPRRPGGRLADQAQRVRSAFQPTAGRHIEALEQALGFSLFVRSPHGFAPTEGARQLKPYVEALASDAAAVLRTASGQAGEARGVVRVTASEVIGAEVLPAILGPVREAHPELAIEFVLSNRIENLLTREADIAVRMVRPDQDALIARHIGDIPLGFFARKDYLKRHGAPQSLADLARHTLIGFDRDEFSARAFAARLGPIDRSMFALRTDDRLRISRRSARASASASARLASPSAIQGSSACCATSSRPNSTFGSPCTEASRRPGAAGWSSTRWRKAFGTAFDRRAAFSFRASAISLAAPSRGKVAHVEPGDQRNGRRRLPRLGGRAARPLGAARRSAGHDGAGARGACADRLSAQMALIEGVQGGARPAGIRGSRWPSSSIRSDARIGRAPPESPRPEARPATMRFRIDAYQAPGLNRSPTV